MAKRRKRFDWDNFLAALTQGTGFVLLAVGIMVGIGFLIAVMPNGPGSSTDLLYLIPSVFSFLVAGLGYSLLNSISSY